MKSTYETPILRSHGTVEQLTHNNSGLGSGNGASGNGACPPNAGSQFCMS